MVWMKGNRRGWVCGMALALASCGGDDEPAQTGTATEGTSSTPATDDGATAATDADSTGDTAEPLRPNWHEDIAPFVAANCQGCHTEGAVAPFAMDSYEQTGALGPAMLLQVEARVMPPWHAVETDECTPPDAFMHDARLSEEQIQMMRDWVDLGMPEGDPENAAPIPEPPSQDLATPTTTVTMNASVTVQPEGSTLDFFHCLSFDPGNTEDVFVDGLQVLPGNQSIAHHTLMYIDVDGESAAWEDGVAYDCGGGAGNLDNVQLIGAWVPGSRPTETPDGVGILLPAGARIVYNMHYHASVDGAQTDDTTGVALRWSTTPPEYVSQFTLIGAPGAGTVTTPPFLIPAGASGHEEVVEYEVPDLGPVEIRVWAVLNHMHKVGVDMHTSVIQGGDETCLVQTPNWDFDWQRSYVYDTDIGNTLQVQPGDTVRVRCTYENTMDNPAVASALAEVGLSEPQDVVLGEGTLDEMCLAGVGVAYRL